MALIEDFQSDVIDKKITVLSVLVATTLPEVTTPSYIPTAENQLKNTTGAVHPPYFQC